MVRQISIQYGCIINIIRQINITICIEKREVLKLQ